MKRIFSALFLVISCSGAASAATAFATNVATLPGTAVYGGTTSTLAGTSVNPIVKLSTGSRAVVNFDTANPLSYAIIVKHDNGSKGFGSANDSTNMYWTTIPSKTQLTGALAGTASDNANFTGATIAWTSQ